MLGMPTPTEGARRAKKTDLANAPSRCLPMIVAQEPAQSLVYCGPVLRHPTGAIQAANFRSATAF